MANWQNTFNIEDIWQGLKNQDDPDYPEAGKAIANRLQRAKFYAKNEYDLEEIVWAFEDVLTVDDLDQAYSELCDWADQPLPTPVGDLQKKNCWIKTQ